MRRWIALVLIAAALVLCSPRDAPEYFTGTEAWEPGRYTVHCVDEWLALYTVRIRCF